MTLGHDLSYEVFILKKQHTDAALSDLEQEEPCLAIIPLCNI